MKTDNELIAEFMGLVFVKEIDGIYHKSWDWLMPVVERIQSIGYHTSMYHDCDKLTYTYRNEMRIVNSDESKIRYRELSNGETMIQCVYTAVVEFVKWHNQLT
jgi:aspartokinase-like uncharacterized kinase